MLALTHSSLQRRGWLSAALLLAVAANMQSMQAQNYNYPPQSPQQSHGQMDYGQSGNPNDPSQGDPPSRVARVSVVQGNVSLQPAGVEDFSPAGLNYPLTSGDRIYSDNGAITELEAGQLAVRLGGTTDLSVTSMTDQLEQFGLGQGSIHVRTYDLDPSATLEIDTPNVAVTVLAPGDLRVDVSPDGTMTQVTLLSGQARVDGPNFQQQLQPGESLQLTGTDQLYAQDVRRPRADGLDRFSSDRDQTYQNAIVTESDYINPGTIGAADLGQYGDWSNDGDNGAVWYPRGVAADWQPYSVGRWAYVAPWGWTWVETEPWGFAPFHYGRWARFGPRWGWIPGPRIVRPIYSPALVAFVGGGVGVTAWFPLGPREPYVPWYRTSSLYANRINVTNIYSRNTVEVRNIYNQRTTNVYVNNTSFNRSYANRQLATVAIPQNAFAGGRPVREVSMRVTPQQFANAPVLTHPVGNPTRSIMAPAPARALPPRMNRPPVESRAPVFSPGGGGGRPSGVGFDNRNGFGNGGQPSGVNRPGGFGNRPDSANGGFPNRGGNPQQPGQSSNPGQPRSNDLGQRPVQSPGAQPPNGQFPNRENGGQRSPTFRGDPGRTVSPTPIAPAPGAQQPTRGNGDEQTPRMRSGPERLLSPMQIGPGNQQTPRNPDQDTNRGNGAQQPPALRGDPSRTVSPAPVNPTPTNDQIPNRGRGDGQAPNFRGAPGRTMSPMPINPPYHPPMQVNPGGGGAVDPRAQSGAHSGTVPPGQPQPAPIGNVRQWQQQQQQGPPAQNRPQQPTPAPQQNVPQRFQPQPTQQGPAPQPQRQFNPPPSTPRQPAPAAVPRTPPQQKESDKKQ